MSRKQELESLWKRMQGEGSPNVLSGLAYYSKADVVWNVAMSNGFLRALTSPQDLKNYLSEDELALSSVAFAARCFIRYVRDGSVYADFLDPSMDDLNAVCRQRRRQEYEGEVLLSTDYFYHFDSGVSCSQWLEIMAASQKAYDAFFSRTGWALKYGQNLPTAVLEIVSWKLIGAYVIQRPESPSARVEHRDTLLRAVAKRVSAATAIPMGWGNTRKTRMAGQPRPLRTCLVCCAALTGLGVKISPDAADKLIANAKLLENDTKIIDAKLIVHAGPLEPEEGLNPVVEALVYPYQSFRMDAAIDALLTPFQHH